jgi:hypothetical protein
MVEWAPRGSNPAARAGDEAEMRMAGCKVAHIWHTERRPVTLGGAVNALGKQRYVAQTEAAAIAFSLGVNLG